LQLELSNDHGAVLR